MFGIKFVKFEPNNYIFVIKKGRIIKKGQGLAFWYYTQTTSFIKIPIESISTPFIFEELTSDYQTISIQGEAIYKISEPEKIKDQINFSIDSDKLIYLSEDPQKLSQRIINIIKTITKREVENLTLKQVVKATDMLKQNINNNIMKDEYIDSLGIQVTNISILSILPNKETSRALEAATREKILKEADDAIYERRNSSVEQERKIKENELNTEIAVENKKRQIRETQMEAERAVKEKERLLLAEEMSFKIKQEKENKELVELTIQNAKIEADFKAYSIEAIMSTIINVNPEILRTLTLMGMKPEQMIAYAFEDIAKNAEKIGELNISPDLLNSLLKRKE